MRIAAYCRVSTDREEQLDSLLHQKEFFIRYAQQNGHELFHLYADEGITGTSLKRREAFKQRKRSERENSGSLLKDGASSSCTRRGR